MKEITRDDVEKYIAKEVTEKRLTKVLGNRLSDLMEVFPNLQSFFDATESQLLSAYRKFSDSKKDLGKHTYDAHHKLKVHFTELKYEAAKAEKEAIQKQKEAEAAELRENPRFTIKELRGISDLMELSGWDTVDLKRLWALKSAFGFKVDGIGDLTK